MENYLYESDFTERFEQALSSYSLLLFETYLARLNGGEKLVEVAKELGTKPDIIYDRMRRIRKFRREWEKSHKGEE
jgi:hypothetical protein